MTKLKKSLSLYGLTMIAVGSCIGSGIFLVPAKIAQSLPSPTLILMVWLLGGIIALTGALTFAELGGRFPQTGGVYVYLKKAYGDATAFLYGWVILTVITSGAIAALGIGFASYFTQLVGLPESWNVGVGIITIILLTGINILGVKISEAVSNFFTSGKLIGIFIIIIIGLFIAAPQSGEISFDINILNTSENLSQAFSLALIGVLWSYGGWHHASYVSGEAINPQRNVPLAMMIGAAIVTLTYVLTNLAYLYLLPVSEISQSKAVAIDAIGNIYSYGGIAIGILIALSIIGTTSIYTMSAPRIYFAMAKDKVFFPQLAKVHPKYQTPVNAILIQSAWAIILILFWQTFADLITYVVFMDWVFMTLGAIALYIFRRRKQENASTQTFYKTWGYPITPLIFISISIWFIINTLIQKPEQAIAGLILTTLGLLVFWYFNRKKEK